MDSKQLILEESADYGPLSMNTPRTPCGAFNSLKDVMWDTEAPHTRRSPIL
jgi:hypothetical protein